MPLFWSSLSFAAGILLGAWTGLPWTACLAGGVLGVGLAFLASRLRFPRASWAWKRLPALGLAPVVLWAGLSLGAARYQAAQPSFGPETLASHNGQGPSILRGVIAAHPDERDQAVFLRVEVSEITRVGETTQPTHGTLLVRAAPGQRWTYGDAVEITGAPEAPPETADFSYREYLSRQGVYTYLAFASIHRFGSGQGSPLLAAVYALQDRALEQVNRLYPPPESALLAGILLGNDNAIPNSIQQAFKTTGTAHIVAISGFNIAILAGLFATLFTRLLGRWRGAALAAAAVIFYTLLVGAGASVVRAAIMGCVGLLGQQIGRRQVGLNTLAFTSAAMCLFNPFYLWDISFQLSFMATLGLVLFADPLQKGFLRLVERRLPPNVAGKTAEIAGEFFLFTLAAQITTLPLMAFHFGQVSWIALFANPLVLPPQPLVMVLGGLAVLLSWVWFPLGQALAALAWPFVAYTIRVVEAFGQIPHGSLTLGQVSLALVAAYYLALFGWTFLRTRLSNLAGQVFRPALVLTGLIALACLVWRAGMSAPDGRLHLLALPQGGPSSGSFLITTPRGRSVLINGGASFNQLSDALGRRLPLLDPGLDLLVISGRNNADLDALPRALAQFPVRAALWAGDPESGLRAAQALSEGLAAENVPVLESQAGQVVDLGDGAALRVLTNDSSGGSFLLEWKGFRALLPLGEKKDLPEVGVAQVVLLPKDLPAGEQSTAWIAALKPTILLGEIPAELEKVLGAVDRPLWVDRYCDRWESDVGQRGEEVNSF